jgi:hypothetical protein
MSFLKKLLSPPLQASSETKASTTKVVPVVPDSALEEEEDMRGYISSELTDTIAEFIQQWKEEALSLNTNLRIDENRRVEHGYFLDSLMSLVDSAIKPITETSRSGGGNGSIYHENERYVDEREEESDD